MQNGGRLCRYQVGRVAAWGSDFHFPAGISEPRYRHVLVSIDLNTADRPAVVLAFELASLHHSMLTVLHVLPRLKAGRSAHGLDAICLLHSAADEHSDFVAAGPSAEAARPRIQQFVEDNVPSTLRNAVNWRGECRLGAAAETVVTYINDSTADLLVLAVKPNPWWLPVMPLVRSTIERRARANVIVIRGQASH
jgi:hypothetical protein